MGAQWKVVLFYVVLAAVVVVSASSMTPARGSRSRDSILGELLRESLQKTAAARLSRHPANSLQEAAPTGQLNDLENIFQRIRKQAPPAVRCGGGGGGNPYECNDGLMGVWLRLMKNPDYSD